MDVLVIGRLVRWWMVRTLGAETALGHLAAANVAAVINEEMGEQ